MYVCRQLRRFLNKMCVTVPLHLLLNGPKYVRLVLAYHSTCTHLQNGFDTTLATSGWMWSHHKTRQSQLLCLQRQCSSTHYHTRGARVHNGTHWRHSSQLATTVTECSNMQHYSLVPRPSLPPVLDRILQAIKNCRQAGKAREQGFRLQWLLT